MIFTGKSLERVLYALELVKCELHNMIATCPDQVMYEAEVGEYAKEQKQMQKLIDRILKKRGVCEQQ